MRCEVCGESFGPKGLAIHRGMKHQPRNGLCLWCCCEHPCDAVALIARLRAAEAEVERLQAVCEVAREGLTVLHSPHFDWGCNATNCSGQAALDVLAAIDPEAQP